MGFVCMCSAAMGVGQCSAAASGVSESLIMPALMGPRLSAMSIKKLKH
jgi:hypothetical protein